MSDEDNSANADTDDEEREEFPWVAQTPTTRIEGTPVDLIYPEQISSSVEHNGDSFAVVMKDPEVVIGSLWRNEEKPEDGTTAEVIDEETPRPTDYRLADRDDRGMSTKEIRGEEFLMSDEDGPDTYVEVDGFDEDHVLVWYNGLSGNRIGRTLDFNGRPFSRWTDEGYLIKGLYQAPEGWRENPSQRGEMAKAGDVPRVDRAPILRNRVAYTTDDEGNRDGAELLDEPEELRLFIDIDREGRGYRGYVFDADAFEAEFDRETPLEELPTDDYGNFEIDAALDMPYCPFADEVLEQAGYSMQMYTDGDKWQDTPDDWQPTSTSEVDSFGIGVETEGDSDSFPTPKQQQFVNEVVAELEEIHSAKGTSPTPDDAFEGGVTGLIGKYQDQFDRVPEADDVERAVYDQTEHLDPSDLDS